MEVQIGRRRDIEDMMSQKMRKQIQGLCKIKGRRKAEVVCMDSNDSYDSYDSYVMTLTERERADGLKILALSPLELGPFYRGQGGIFSMFLAHLRPCRDKCLLTFRGA